MVSGGENAPLRRSCGERALGAAIAIDKLATSPGTRLALIVRVGRFDGYLFVIALPRRRHMPTRGSGGNGEAHLSTEQPETSQDARLPSAHGYQRWPGSAEGASGQGPTAAVGLIWSLRGKAAFAALSQAPRARTSHLSLRYVVDSPDSPAAAPPRVAFSITRAVGSAVVRNRVRRQLRALADQAAADGRLSSGSYLIAVRPSAVELTFVALSAEFDRLCRLVVRPS